MFVFSTLHHLGKRLIDSEAKKHRKLAKLQHAESDRVKLADAAGTGADTAARAEPETEASCSSSSSSSGSMPECTVCFQS
eukprot:CAMPEP_0197857048 /NCGR_PEP_ID=MMETSP1438-20131217/29768_1 /TAXON_ID=1461541 /ORGANISM="Pterosperma sp., Strain CCMP1384" /LENGTH=79 /DNA_ID=CAMNT_0043472735 /DNA_START=75 /DNA_END=311 /DNA_ORIENTATION=+